jgi:thioredoxin
MKKISGLVLVLFLLASLSCTSAGDNNRENSTGAIKEGVVNQLTTEMFKKLVYDYQKNPKDWVYEGKLPCIIDFYADWCRPCRMVAPIMEELANQYKGKVVFYKLNTDQEMELSQLFKIQSIPVILYVPANEKPQMSVGLSGKEEYTEQIKSLLLKPEANNQH